MLPEENEQAIDRDALAARLSQLAPASAGSLQAKFFYEAGYRAAFEEARVTNVRRQLWLAAACSLLAVGAGVLAARLPFVGKSQTVAMVVPEQSRGEHIAAPERVVSADQVERVSETTVGSNLDHLRTEGGGFRTSRFVTHAFANYLTTWVERNSMHGGIKIGPIGASWDELVVAQTPPISHGQSVQLPSAPTIENDLLFPERALYRKFELNPFKRVLAN